MAALEDLTGLLASLPNSALLTDKMKQDALAQALVPDSFNVWPGTEGYEPTYDIYWAALSLIGFLQSQPFVKQSSSEGTSVTVDAPNWGGLAAYYRSMSQVAQATSAPVLRSVAIPGGPHVDHTDMSDYDGMGRVRKDGNVDTDLG